MARPIPVKYRTLPVVAIYHLRSFAYSVTSYNNIIVVRFLPLFDNTMFPTPLQSWLCFLILFITTVAVLSLAFTHPKSHQRDAASLLVICLYILFYRDTQFLQNETLKIALNTFSIIQIGHIVRIVSVDRLSYIPEQLQHANHSKVAISTTDGRRFSWALSAVFNFRAIHTTEQAKGTPRFHRGHINYVPSRMRFLSVKCLTLTVRILILAVWGGGWPLLHLPDDCAAPKEYLFSRLGDVTPQEVVQRTWATFLFWLRGYLNHSTAYDLISVVCVASKQSNPISWPPMYGSLTDSYTIRGWWGSVNVL